MARSEDGAKTETTKPSPVPPMVAMKMLITKSRKIGPKWMESAFGRPRVPATTKTVDSDWIMASEKRISSLDARYEETRAPMRLSLRQILRSLTISLTLAVTPIQTPEQAKSVQ